MHISAVLSNLGTWEMLKEQFGELITDLQEAILDFDLESLPKNKSGQKFLHKSVKENLVNKGWKKDVTPAVKSRKIKKVWRIDAEKMGIGFEACFDLQSNIERQVFVKCPFLFKIGQLKVVLFVVPMKTLAKKLKCGANFEDLKDLIIELRSFPLKYPFVICGISSEKSETEVLELTSGIDNLLLDTIGCSLDEAILLGEKAGYEFKVQIPKDKKLAQEICAFANRKGGGIILLGVADDGKIKGIDKEDLDDIQLRIINIIRSCCNPIPEYSCEPFALPLDPHKNIIVIHIFESKLKPCMTEGKIYIRSGPSVRVASPEEVRKLVYYSFGSFDMR